MMNEYVIYNNYVWWMGMLYIINNYVWWMGMLYIIIKYAWWMGMLYIILINYVCCMNGMLWVCYIDN